MKVLSLILLFLLPVIPCFFWYLNEYEEHPSPFASIKVKRVENITPDKAKTIYDLTSAWYESTKNEFPVQFDKQKTPSEFKLKVSKSITERLGIFSSLPYHKVCLINRNKVYIDEILLSENQSPNIGAAAINQENGYNFHAERGNKDCKSVLINKFRQNSSSPELVYPITININPEEDEKRLRREEFVVNLATTSVETTNTTITISLHWWTMTLAYLILLFAWSFVFFQYEKILDFLRKKILEILN
jgi:hypothetical protein